MTAVLRMRREKGRERESKTSALKLDERERENREINVRECVRECVCARVRVCESACVRVRVCACERPSFFLFFQIKLDAIKINGSLNCVKFLVGSI